MGRAVRGVFPCEDWPHDRKEGRKWWRKEGRGKQDSKAPSDVAATLGALMRVYGDGDDREDLSDFWQLAD